MDGRQVVATLPPTQEDSGSDTHQEPCGHVVAPDPRAFELPQCRKGRSACLTVGALLRMFTKQKKSLLESKSFKIMIFNCNLVVK